jgi:hypothetical protein
MMNQAENLKLGMNSEFTLYDQLVLDPDLTAPDRPDLSGPPFMRGSGAIASPEVAAGT